MCEWEGLLEILRGVISWLWSVREWVSSEEGILSSPSGEDSSRGVSLPLILVGQLCVSPSKLWGVSWWMSSFWVSERYLLPSISLWGSIIWVTLLSLLLPTSSVEGRLDPSPFTRESSLGGDFWWVTPLIKGEAASSYLILILFSYLFLFISL